MKDGVKEQTEAAAVNRFNTLRADEFLRGMEAQKFNLEAAKNDLQNAKDFIANPEHILGSDKAKHGETAEKIEEAFKNADKHIVGEAAEITTDGVGRLDKTDFLKDGKPVQSKFYNGPTKTFDAINAHLEKYPDFIESGGTYVIPKDQYAQISNWLDMPAQELAKLTNEDGGRIARNLVKKIREFEAANGVDFKDAVQPATVTYQEVQLGNADKTIEAKEGEIAEKDGERREIITEKAKPSLAEGLKAAGIAALIDGVISFASAVLEKFKEGKKLSEFTEEDWNGILVKSGIGLIRGGITGLGIYALTNYAEMSAGIAGAFVAAAFGMVRETVKLAKGEISAEQFVEGIGDVIVNSAVAGVGAAIGQAIIPIPVVGAFIGSVAAQHIYGFIEKAMTKTRKVSVPLLQTVNENSEKFRVTQLTEHERLIHFSESFNFGETEELTMNTVTA